MKIWGSLGACAILCMLSLYITASENNFITSLHNESHLSKITLQGDPPWL